MKKRIQTSLLLTAVALGLAFGGAWAAMTRLGNALSDGDIRLLIGMAVTLFIVIIVARLFIAWNTAQIQLRQQLADLDEVSQLKKVTGLLQIMGGNRSPVINARPPTMGQGQHTVEQHYLPGGQVVPYWMLPQPGMGARAGGANGPPPAQGQQPPTAPPDTGGYRDSLDME